ncbi:MAG: protein kinase [Chloroflexi bacterium]|nr:protein kinase [Chloroflexota bacterium]
MTNLVGRTINGRYRLESLLGDGGMGTVYRAYDLNLDRQVAIKLMHAHFARRAEFRARLIQEAKTAAQLDHPSAVGIYDFGESEDGLFIAMEYVDGGSLRDHLRRLQKMQKYLPLVQSLQITSQIADALDFAHRRGIVHRDVKPGNILLKRLSRPDEPGEQPFRAILTDFGLVKLQEGDGLTQSGATLGTPTYMSPEQCSGETLDGRSDLYSLGIVLYELVTNRLPFTFQSLSEALSAHTRGNMPLPAQELRTEVPVLVDTILARTLAKNPADRYTNGAELADALRSAMVALSGAPTQVMIREELDILERVNEPPPGYELLIDTPGHTTSNVPLTRSVITLGRHADNDIVLPAEGVSRHHARLQATALGWEVLDLGGINGTFLNERRLRADDPTPMMPGAQVRVGPYALTLRGPEVSLSGTGNTPHTVPGGTTPSLEDQKTAVPELKPLAIFLANDKVHVEPGETAELHVEVVNQSPVDDRVSLRVQGVSPSWIVSPAEFVTLPAGQTIPLTISLRPPKNQNTPTGRQRFRLALVSQRHPDAKLAVNASLILGSFVAFEAAVEPDLITLPGMAVVSIQNTGNADADFSLVARDHQRELQFRGERGRIRLQPGQTAKVELEVDGKRAGLFGGGQLYSYEVEVASTAGGRQLLTGSARSGASIPPSLLYAFVFVLTFACAVFGYYVLSSRGFFDGGDPTLTPTVGVSVVNATETAVSATATAVELANIAATAALQGDSDGDGISDESELKIGTDPNNPDTDGDGLTDGDEQIIHGTQPLLEDSDGDLLSDFEEINEYGTDPMNIDTDGDGVSDAQEIIDGTDPVATLPASATPTETGVPTAVTTPTITNTPAPSAVPTITNTPLPTSTATNTPLPTTTFTPSPLPTITPTSTPAPTLAPTSTPTNTPVPNLQLTCTDSPPVINGMFDITEWPTSPIAQFAPDTAPENLVQVYFVRDETKLYMAFLINDDSVDATDSLRLYFDTIGNEGDPDTADRFYRITREGTVEIRAGRGNNSDTLEWGDPDEAFKPFWVTGFAGPGSSQWVVELEIDTVSDMAALGDPFGMMSTVLFTGELASFPELGDSNNPTTFHGVTNIVCPSG